MRSSVKNLRPPSPPLHTSHPTNATSYSQTCEVQHPPPLAPAVDPRCPPRPLHLAINHRQVLQLIACVSKSVPGPYKRRVSPRRGPEIEDVRVAGSSGVVTRRKVLMGRHGQSEEAEAENAESESQTRTKRTKRMRRRSGILVSRKFWDYRRVARASVANGRTSPRLIYHRKGVLFRIGITTGGSSFK